MTSWRFGRSKRPEWILQPDVVIHSSSFDPYRTKHEFDKVLGVGEWKVDNAPLTDRYDFYVRQSLTTDVVAMINGIAAGNSPSYYRSY
ncbi:hypothetical protein CEP54_003971 [Fusarium duplospermum]|uniref:Uncharacterized protein n=1 Tax=Fusarium duplospermum TaxID=1325734 RepID=A0A428QKI8_9HYPO|nr:hypothetical protein CEP54_003971 [Fusarium duplospermum]